MTISPLFTPASPLPALSRRWLLIGVWSLAIAGLFSLALVIARTPGLDDIPLFSRIFHEALAVHVDLSVLVWFLSIACLLWSLAASHAKPLIPCIEEAAQWCFILGMAGIAGSVLDQRGQAVMSNYIPVITSPVFFFGLALLMCGAGLMVLRLLTSCSKDKKIELFSPVIHFAIYSSGVIAAFALGGFIWSFRVMPGQLDATQYYELLFWGGGHVLQFTHTQLLLVSWLWLAAYIKPNFSPSPKLLYPLFAVGILAAFASSLAYAKFEVASFEFREFFTQQMIAAGGIAPALLALGLLPLLWKHRAEKHGLNGALWTTLCMSVLLFIYGGILAGMIRGQNVVIPAHYHGSIVGITLAFMGLAYALLPRFGYKHVADTRLAFWQPIMYGGGQLMHISGLAWSGGYGVLRKTPGAINEISPGVKAAMGLMGLGGLLAIIGGLMFVVVVYKAVRKEKSAA